MLQNAFNSAKRLDHVRSVIVQIPQLSIMSLMGPPEGILLQNLIRFELGSHSPSLVVGQRVSVLLEQCVDARNATVPTIVQVLQRKSPVLCIGLLSLKRIFGPHALRVHKFRFPWLYKRLLFIIKAIIKIGDIITKIRSK